MKIFYFTGTGNSLAVAKNFDAELISIPQIIHNENIDYKDDVIGIVYPTYCFTVPKMVLEFIEKANLNADFIFAVATCGGSAGSAPKKMHHHAKKHGVTINYSTSIEVVDNYLPLADMQKRKDNFNPIKFEASVLNLEKRVSKKLPMVTTSKIPMKVGDIIYKVIMSEKKAQKFQVNDQCTLCTTCQKVCPANNIEVTSSVNFKSQCTNCFACLHLCPLNAIHLKNEKSNERWLNPDVTIREIIKSNYQR